MSSQLNNNALTAKDCSCNAIKFFQKYNKDTLPSYVTIRSVHLCITVWNFLYVHMYAFLNYTHTVQVCRLIMHNSHCASMQVNHAQRAHHTQTTPRDETGLQCVTTLQEEALEEAHVRSIKVIDTAYTNKR